MLTAPEVQTSSVCSILSDMFSLGMVMCAIFNHGKPLIQANHSSSTYVKQLDLVSKKHFNSIPMLVFKESELQKIKNGLKMFSSSLYDSIFAPPWNKNLEVD